MNISYSFFITTLAGFSTLIGSLLIFIKFKNINRIISYSLSFAAGVMLSISLFDLLKESIKLFYLNYNMFLSILLFLIFLIVGMLLSLSIEKFLPEGDNLYKVGLISMIAIIFHNIPEGIITFITSSIDKKLGLSLALAISMHNIPEGISISVPIYYSTKNKYKAIFYTFLSAISEVFGALISFIFLKKYINDIFIAILLSIVCGIMIYISIFELLPEVKRYNYKMSSLFFFIFGVIIMIINIICS